MSLKNGNFLAKMSKEISRFILYTYGVSFLNGKLLRKERIKNGKKE